MTSIAFASLFLGLVLGNNTIGAIVEGPVAAVEFQLDGEPVARLAKPPWSTRIDLGADISPHELTARALDSSGVEIARVRQWLNLPRPQAETQIVLERDESGRAIAAHLSPDVLVIDPMALHEGDHGLDHVAPRGVARRRTGAWRRCTCRGDRPGRHAHEQPLLLEQHLERLAQRRPGDSKHLAELPFGNARALWNVAFDNIVTKPQQDFPVQRGLLAVGRGDRHSGFGNRGFHLHNSSL